LFLQIQNCLSSLAIHFQKRERASLKKSNEAKICPDTLNLEKVPNEEKESMLPVKIEN